MRLKNPASYLNKPKPRDEGYFFSVYMVWEIKCLLKTKADLAK
jgi:hypothetical protein